MRLIDADETISELRALPEQERLEYMGVYDLIKSIPTIDAEPVVHGHYERVFEKLICENFNGKPYYSIQYIENGEIHIGYSSYKLDIISDYLKKYFICCGQALDWSEQ